MTDKNDKWKPCPFCGSADIQHEEDEPQYYWTCRGCDMHVNNVDNLSWNMRTQ